jgi:hypothetical protein
MPKRTAIAFACLIAACGGVRGVLSEDEMPGCMYYRNRPVHPKCVDEMASAPPETPYSYSQLRKCQSENYGDAISVSATVFVEESGKQSSMPACLHDGRSSKRYYRYDSAAGRVYSKYLSCRDGCFSRSAVHSIEFDGDGIRTSELASRDY